MEAKSTIVTAYFKLEKSKASHAKYLDWMRNMLIIDNPMVIFCDESSVLLIERLRELAGHAKKTRVIPTRFEDFYCYRYIDVFKKHMDIDHERAIHSIELYLIWNEKSNFLRRAIEANPFSSEKFVWCDIGCFRRPNTEFVKWPNPDRVTDNKITLMVVEPFTEDEMRTNLPSFQYKNRISASIFAGDKYTLIRWHQIYYGMLEYYIQIGRFIGKDQSIMNNVYLVNRDMCELVRYQHGRGDIWFYLQYHLL
jgi:hypothetical protein